MSCKITHFYLESNILLSNFLLSCLITIELPFPLLNIYERFTSLLPGSRGFPPEFVSLAALQKQE